MATAAPPEKPQVEAEEERDQFSTWDCGSPLYDSFEVASLCHVLDRHLMFLPVDSGGSAGSEDAPAAAAAARLVSADGNMVPAVKDREKKLRKTRKHGKCRSSTAAGGNEKVVLIKATLRGICSALTTFWRKQ